MRTRVTARAGGPRRDVDVACAARRAPRRARCSRGLHRGLRVVPWLPLLALAGCSGTAARSAADPPPAPNSSAEPVRVVAEFLDAANRRDLAAMASRFGTADGPIGARGGALGCALRKAGSWIGLGDRCLTAREVELRMDLMAAILAHDSRRIGSPAAVAGRGRAATRVEVEVDTAGGRGVVVPFVLIRTDDGSWLVQEVGLSRVPPAPPAPPRSTSGA